MAPLVDILQVYDFVLPKHTDGRVPALDLPNVQQGTIDWVIPTFGIGSDGQINIFRLVRGLELNGYKCHITIVGGCDFASGEDARQSIVKNFE
jgi:hypothetical protein